MNRRHFVKSSAAIGGTGLLLGSGPLQAMVHNSVNDVIKIAMIGCGGRATGAAIQALSTKQNVQLVAMADAFPDRIDESVKAIKKEIEDSGLDKNKFAVTPDKMFSGFDAYKKVIPLCDVVIIATPPGFRPIHFKEAIAQNKHVFMEKPVATDAVGVRSVLETAQKAKDKKLNVVVGLQRHYQKVYQRWVEALHEGAIGDITASRVYWNDAGVWVKPRQPNQTEMEYQMRNWYYFVWLCGDHINEQHIHNLDVGNWVKQAYPINARGMGGRQTRTGKEYGEIFDHFAVEYEYADGSRMYSQCRHSKGCLNMVTEQFDGTNGVAPKPGLIQTRKGFVLLKHDDKKDANPYQVEHDELFAAVAANEYKFADAENGAKATLTAIMGRMAAYSGQLVEWDKALNSTINLQPNAYTWDTLPKTLPDKDGWYDIPMPGKTVAV
ncbi:MAG: Gfo/Idh/MocA family oxidoreductase [Saprospiraceae bacterium]|jgi:predicted dehydrogenase|nr:Gfo/Idh/MocA family oxidoreductase [Saprospiraceae bacterium]MBK6478625.1 Gfo/Idh/MocA family oxidoreductase [Saprospiraceae bacterium]MBK6814119.1 Gfo/Idh/MocA family oxidoreductase [Saprospiraceae bacterium]MBK7373557.1 Gfo/Idh/MocA family oxidoreductase [Saprospiraceae bacterium]MBK7437231.1 Gfo/Idh/MocA family oxidoreductase [Saprospiraceae bacterium]